GSPQLIHHARPIGHRSHWAARAALLVGIHSAHRALHHRSRLEGICVLCRAVLPHSSHWGSLTARPFPARSHPTTRGIGGGRWHVARSSDHGRLTLRVLGSTPGGRTVRVDVWIHDHWCHHLNGLPLP